MINKNLYIAAVVTLALTCAAPAQLRAEDAVEKAGVVTGVTVGNTIVVPLKAMSVVMGGLAGVLSFILTGGDTEVTQQVWRDASQGPYIITPEVARMAVGQRPQLAETK